MRLAAAMANWPVPEDDDAWVKLKNGVNTNNVRFYLARKAKIDKPRSENEEGIGGN